MRNARAWIKGLAVFVGLTLALSGCLKLDMALTISPGDTVDGEMVFAVNKDLLELTGQSVDDLLDGTSVPDDIEGATQEPYEDDRFVGTRVRFEDVALSDLQEGSDADSISIERVGDTYEVTGVMDLTSDDADLVGNPFEDQIGDAFDTAELRVAITFPGEVLETNGQVDGTTVTWVPVFGERTDLMAVASASGEGADQAGDGEEGTQAAGSSSDGDGNTALYVILGLVILGLVAGIFLLMRRGGGDTTLAGVSDGEPGVATEIPAIPDAPVAPAVPPAPRDPDDVPGD